MVYQIDGAANKMLESVEKIQIFLQFFYYDFQ